MATTKRKDPGKKTPGITYGYLYNQTKARRHR